MGLVEETVPHTPHSTGDGAADVVVVGVADEVIIDDDVVVDDVVEVDNAAIGKYSCWNKGKIVANTKSVPNELSVILFFKLRFNENGPSFVGDVLQLNADEKCNLGWRKITLDAEDTGVVAVNSMVFVEKGLNTFFSGSSGWDSSSSLSSI